MMVGGMCSMLPYGLGVCHYAYTYIYIKKKSSTDKSDKSPRYQLVLAFCAFSTSVIPFHLFFQKLVFDVCMFCSIFVSRLLLWILKKIVVS